MKRFILIVFILIPISSFCQEQFPIFSEDNFWWMKHFESTGTEEYYSVEISGDTIIDDKQYKLIKNTKYNYSYGFGYDEDKITHFRPLIWPDSNDIIIYDFNLEVGDTFNQPHINLFDDTVYYEKIIIVDIDNVELNDGTFRKRFAYEGTTIYDVCLSDKFWIDGIGNSFHPVYPIFECFEYGEQLDCYFYQDEEMLGECLYSPIREISKPFIEIFPNPTHDKVHIVSIDGETVSIQLFSVDGRLLFSQKWANELGMDDFPNGVYVLKIQLNSGPVIIKKIMKCE